MLLVRISEPDWPVYPGELVDHARTDGEELPLVSAYVAAASEYAQEFTRRAVCLQTFDGYLDEFPTGPIALPLPPLQSVASVKYTAPDGTEQTWSTSDYVVDVAAGRIYPAYGKQYPETLDVLNAVRIRFTTGYPREGTAPDDYPTTPDSIRAAILLLAADLFENREGQSVAALHENKTVERLLSPWRVY